MTVGLSGPGIVARRERPTRRAIFLDKDGTLVDDVPYNVDPARLRFAAGAIEALRGWKRDGWLLVVVTNQSGLATGRFTEAQFAVLRKALSSRLRSEAGIELDGFHVCPHRPADAAGFACDCRKPLPGMLRAAAAEHDIDLARSWMVGDILDDVEAGRRAGCRTVLIDNGNETVWRRSPLREPHHRVPDLGAAARAIRCDAAFDSADEAAPASNAAACVA